MAKIIDKVVQQKSVPNDKNVLWDDGKNLKINRNGKWESANNSETNNLSIDPIVLKYICNPHIVEYKSDSDSCYNPVPKELSDIIYQNGKFNHLVLSTILIKDYNNADYDDEWVVERIISYDNEGCVMFSNSTFVYDPKTRLFVV